MELKETQITVKLNGEAQILITISIDQTFKISLYLKTKIIEWTCMESKTKSHNYKVLFCNKSV